VDISLLQAPRDGASREMRSIKRWHEEKTREKKCNINRNRNGHTCRVTLAAREVIKRAHPCQARKASPLFYRSPFERSVRRWRGVDGVRSAGVIKPEVQWPAVRFNRGEKRLRASRPRGRRHARDFVNVHDHYDGGICSPFVLIS